MQNETAEWGYMITDVNHIHRDIFSIIRVTLKQVTIRIKALNSNGIITPMIEVLMLAKLTSLAWKLSIIF